MANEIPVTQARAEFADLINRVVYGNERIILTRHGKPIVALVPAADLQQIDSEPALIRTVSTLNPAAASEPHHFGIAARHNPPDTTTGSDHR